MAKKNKDDILNDNGTEKATVGNKIVTILIVVAMVVIWLAVFGALIKFDVGGFGSTVLKPILKDIPIINKVLPNMTEEEFIKEEKLPFDNVKDAAKLTKELEQQIKDLKKQIEDKDTNTSDLQKEIDRLKVFEDNQLEYEKKKKEFETKVVFNENAPSVEEYRTFYESIQPDHAAELYKQVLEQQQVEEAILAQSKRFAAMKAEEAAPILETMTGDIELVSTILKNMKENQSAAILAKMDPVNAARITKKMSGMN